MGPLRSFRARANSCRLTSWPISGGIAPDNRLTDKPRRVSLWSKPTSGGISPVNWLYIRVRLVRLLRLPISGGMGPDRRVSARTRVLRFARSPISGGISPKSPSSRETTRDSSRESLPISGAIAPFRPLLESSSAVTRPSASVRTPNHSPSGASVNQPSLRFQSGPPRES